MEITPLWLTQILEHSQALHSRIGTRWMQVGAIVVHLIMGAVVGTAASLLAGTQLSPVATVAGTALVQICLAYAWHRWLGPQINAASISMINKTHSRRLPDNAHVQIPVPDAWIAPLATTVSLATTMEPSGTTVATIILIGAATAGAEMMVKGDTIDRIRTGQAYWEREIAKLHPNAAHVSTRRNKQLAGNQRRSHERGGQQHWTSSIVTVAVVTLLIAGLAALSMGLTNLAAWTAAYRSHDATVAIPQPLLLILLTAPPALLLLLSAGLLLFAVAVIVSDYRKSRNSEGNK